MKLAAATPSGWLPLALAQLDAVLMDHAHCEKKAAANALSLLQHYPDLPGLPVAMARLAQEEAAHLAQVLVVLERRGLVLGRDPGDPYVQGLLPWIRTGAAERRLDRLLVAGVVEARSHERLSMLAQAIPDETLARMYERMAQSEHGHETLFVRLAEQAAGAAPAQARLESLLAWERSVVESLPLRAAIH